ncbi:MAG: glutathione S-transferase family protein [Candidatus Thiodiazotropha sp. (ex Rostrolucina anterorostrata)]|nr:glutathione S-transferase family protein [Candidatus Thiodiazotropha sp. (ex Rostrolucina anterorostrata)]
MTSRQGSFLRHVRLSVADWLVGGGVTIADIACYPYVSLAPEGAVSLQPYPGVRSWLERLEALPGWEALLSE